ncbi:MAG: malonyl-CoA decarboxylase family protein [Alphaproteobacteria bacterium]
MKAGAKTIGIFDRTLSGLRGALVDVARVARGPFSRGLRADLPDDDAQRLRAQIAECLAEKGGVVSARARAIALGREYLALDAQARIRFLTILAEEFDVNHEAVRANAQALVSAPSGATRLRLEAELRRSLVAPRSKLLQHLNAVPDGLKFLIDLRADLLAQAGGKGVLAGLERDLRDLLATWCDVGFVNLRRITWSEPAALLEKLIAYEAVHEIRSWQDLHNRLDSDRRCFAFIHPRMPLEPLIFVEVALVQGLATNIHVLLDETAPVLNPHEADTAIFYSISNAQKGLAGISMGEFLIKRVVEELKREFPNLKTFATLSPVPGFRHWLDERIQNQAPTLFDDADRKLLHAAGVEPADERGLVAFLAAQPGMRYAVASALMKLCAHYLVNEKREDGIRARDPVAHFHLTNGAQLAQINSGANAAPAGERTAYGLMVNYLYRLSDIERNVDAYAENGHVAVAKPVRALMIS